VSPEETRPRGGGAGIEQADETWTPAYGLRRRRQASHRLPALLCGHRCPLDCPLDWPEPYEGDYWHDVGADLTMAQLVTAGMGA